MYVEQGEQRYEKPASPIGVRIVVIVLLISGLALAALPLTVLLSGGEEPGRIVLENASGTDVTRVRVIRTVGAQERLVGSTNALPAGSRTDVTFDAEGSLRLRVEFATPDGRRTVPLVLDEPVTAGTATTIRIGDDFALSVRRGAERALPEPHTPPPVEPAEDASAPAPDEGPQEIASAGPFELPDGWSEKWRPWFRHVDWTIGPEAGMRAAGASGKPMMLFYTATW